MWKFITKYIRYGVFRMLTSWHDVDDKLAQNADNQAITRIKEKLLRSHIIIKSECVYPNI